MRITVSELKRIIKEEVRLAESTGNNPVGGEKGAQVGDLGSKGKEKGAQAGDLESKGGENAYVKLSSAPAFETAVKLLKTPKDLATFMQQISKTAADMNPALKKGEKATLQSFASAEKKRTST